MSNLFDYDQTPANNNSSAPDGAPEGWAPSDVNNVVRQFMANGAGAFNVYTAAGTADAQTVTMSPTLAAYSTKVRVAFIPVANNTGACTLNVNGLGATAIKMPDGTDPPAGALNSNMVALVQYDGTDFALINPAVVVIPASQVTEISNLTAAEGAQLENINSVTISNGQWAWLGGLASAPLEDNDLAANGGTVTEEGRTNYFTEKQEMASPRTISIRRSDGDGTSGYFFDINSDEITTGNFNVRIGRETDTDGDVLFDLFNADGTGTAWFSARKNSGVVVGNPTGNFGGAGTINAEGLRVNNDPVLVDGDIGSTVQAQGAVLDDLNTLGAAATDGQFIVATGAGAFAYESGATARASLGLTIGTDVQAQDAQLQDLADNLTATAAELNQLDGITRVGDVIAEESFSIGGSFSDTGYAKKEKGSGGDWVTVWLPAMTHSSSSQPSSAAGDLPSAYRPSLSTGKVYHFLGTAVYKVDISTVSAGRIDFEYRDWDGVLITATTTNRPVSITYFVPD